MAFLNVPVGTIIMWENLAIPSGWVVCNGANGTPDLRAKFIRGASLDGDVRATGGSDTHTHTNPNTDTRADHNHGGSFGLSVGGGGTEKSTSGSGDSAASAGHSHPNAEGTVNPAGAHSHTVGDTGSASTIPKYVYRVFIRRNT